MLARNRSGLRSSWPAPRLAAPIGSSRTGPNLLSLADSHRAGTHDAPAARGKRPPATLLLRRRTSHEAAASALADPRLKQESEAPGLEWPAVDQS